MRRILNRPSSLDDPIARARARALAQLIACDIPTAATDVGPLRYLKNKMGQEQSAIDAWCHHWVLDGFDALEALIVPGPYCCGSQVTVADICLVPQSRECQAPRGPARQDSPRLSRSMPRASSSRLSSARAPKTGPDAE